MDNLECPICLEIAENAVECIQCAQILCQKCTVELKRCPICRKESSFKDSAFARKLINNLPKTCDDCGMKTTIIEFKNHVCPNRKIKCGFCQFVGFRAELISHAAQIHSKEIMDNFGGISNKKSNLLLWENKLSKLTHVHEMIITRTGLQPFKEIVVKYFITSKNTSYLVVGLTHKRIIGVKGYLGGDFGEGNWGLAGNGALGQEGKWLTGCKFASGDTVTVKLANSVLTYQVNGVSNDYSHRFKYPQVYIACTMFNYGDSIEVLES